MGTAGVPMVLPPISHSADDTRNGVDIETHHGCSYSLVLQTTYRKGQSPLPAAILSRFCGHGIGFGLPCTQTLLHM
ncbi:hypothetical protein BgAZ_108360 [Babesia gibsoni]|uniref:Uncharacterized protein n=1 Tax=Babesia gibsoni TaxID=33632 RepID=A0AAD8PG94_BABGI|nr:hypothetical protein BgAZ_108360 [Babesia gibsoni]